jgi:hypothetical protein
MASKITSAFVSYAWEGDMVIWANSFATQLREDGIEGDKSNEITESKW